MADISRITLPSGNSYDIKDQTARDLIAGRLNFYIVWAQEDWESSTAPTPAKLATVPYGVDVYYAEGTESATGTLPPTITTKGNFYLIYSNTQTATGARDVFDEYVTVIKSENPEVYDWEKLGDTQIDLSGVVTDVILNRRTTNFITDYPTPAKDQVIGADSTFTVTQPTITVTPTTTYMGATATQANTQWNNKDQVTAVTGISTTQKKLTTVDQTTATGAGTTSTTNTDWLRGISVQNETLIIGAATLNTQITTLATGQVSDTSATSNVGATVAISSQVSATDNVIGSDATFTVTQPTITLAENPSSAAGRVQVMTAASATATNGDVQWNNKDIVNPITNLGTPDRVSGLNSNTYITVLKGNEEDPGSHSIVDTAVVGTAIVGNV